MIFSAVVDGVVSIQRALVVFSTEASVAAIKAVVEVVVPKDNSPPVPAENEALADDDGDREEDGLRLALGEYEALDELLGLSEEDGLRLAEGLRDALGDDEALELPLGLAEPDGLTLPLGESEELIDALGE